MFEFTFMECLLIWLVLAVFVLVLVGLATQWLSRDDNGTKHWFVATVYDAKNKKIYHGSPDMAWHILTYHAEKKQKYTVITTVTTEDPRQLET